MGENRRTKEEIQDRIVVLETRMQAGDFWRDKTKAQAMIKELNQLKSELISRGGDETSNAVVTIAAGAGGDDAEDFVRMLFEMYSKYAVRRGFKVFVIHRSFNDHGGFRHLTFLMRGRGAYVILKNESGVHRLVRLSPFDAKRLRHTSFVSVEVLPELSGEREIKIDPVDVKIDFFRSSGPGGQNVNKRETAVRLTHLPTGFTVHSEAERSQEQNRSRALAILWAKLQKREEEERRIQRAAGLKAAEPSWGNQIRSYVLHPYKLVKDHRRRAETSDVEGVFNGDIDLFLS